MGSLRNADFKTIPANCLLALCISFFPAILIASDVLKTHFYKSWWCQNLGVRCRSCEGTRWHKNQLLSLGSPVFQQTSKSVSTSKRVRNAGFEEKMGLYSEERKLIPVVWALQETQGLDLPASA